MSYAHWSEETRKRVSKRGKKASPWNKGPMVENSKNRERMKEWGR